MSTRQNKKRKGRGNHLNRERTVTTLTEGPEGSFMASEEPHPNLTSSPFSVASSAAGPSATLSPTFSMTPSFQPYFGYPPSSATMSTQSFSQQQTPTSLYSIPAAQNDLEVLERLKETIKNNQHEYFKPAPQPRALESVYLGPHKTSRVPPHPEQ
ncbi:hypothetical protein BDW22DRAFT_1382528, partial [Trametopsis cervina]